MKLNTDPRSDYVQQGDVLIFDEFMIPSTAKPQEWARETGRIVLAFGEATGHCHEVSDPSKVEIYEDVNGTLWLDVKEDVSLTHQEHGTQVLTKGVKRIGRVREKDPLSDIVRPVAD